MASESYPTFSPKMPSTQKFCYLWHWKFCNNFQKARNNLEEFSCLVSFALSFRVYEVEILKFRHQIAVVYFTKLCVGWFLIMILWSLNSIIGSIYVVWLESTYSTHTQKFWVKTRKTIDSESFYQQFLVASEREAFVFCQLKWTSIVSLINFVAFPMKV